MPTDIRLPHTRCQRRCPHARTRSESTRSASARIPRTRQRSRGPDDGTAGIRKSQRKHAIRPRNLDPIPVLIGWITLMSGRYRCDNPTVYECPVCGSKELTAKPYETWPPPQEGTSTPPYEDYLGKPSYEVCLNCGF